jgi:hypothetical protein
LIGGGPAASGRRATAGVLLAWSLLAVGDGAGQGTFDYPNLILVTLGLAALVVVVAVRAPLALPDRALLVVPVLICVVAAAHATHRYDLYMALTRSGQQAVNGLSITAAAVAGLGMFTPRRWQRALWAAVVALVVATGLVIIVGQPDPTVDVWLLLQQSSDGLRHGADMYRQHWVGSTGLQAVYPYLPATTVLLAPFKWLLGDVRFGLIAASLLGAGLVRRTAPEAPLGLAALIVIVPHWSLLIDHSWTEPLLIAACAGAILALRAERPGLAIVALALGLACKQHLVLLLPLFAIWPSFGWRRTLAAVGLAVVLVLPWFIAGPGDLWHDAVHANLSLGVQTRALNLPSLFVRHGFTVGFWFVAVMLVAAYALAFTRLPRTPSGLALGAALIMWTLDIANKQTYFNHYMLPLGLLVIAIAAAERPAALSRPQRATRQEVLNTE